MNIAEKFKKHGVLGSFQKAYQLLSRKIHRSYYCWSVKGAPEYKNPTSDELIQIENDLADLGVLVQDYSPSPDGFIKFQQSNYFPFNYHGGIASPVWDEKLLEHWIAAERLDLSTWESEDIYIDVAAANSPWAEILRKHFRIQAFAIDLDEVGGNYKDLPYYRIENATATTFDRESITGMSLQCAYEMFMKDDDTKLIAEIERILRPGGKVVISPLYLHTHHCAYSTPEYYGKGYSDPSAKEYVNFGCFGIPSSRKYSAKSLKQRVLNPIVKYGMRYQLLALRNKTDLGKNIYCHFILEIVK
ncbi:MAG: hypothetical protein QNJ46_11800 [Leptolyngbyaceae cyanobacterium MO_188.B28]|nr:hypothetical protein [Leptolyngbyaceae cyanobacterium MO_188.B28]